MSCVFCQIVDGELPSDILYQDDTVLAFRDVHPQTPVHLLIIPRKHISSLNQLADAEVSLVGHMATVGIKLAKKEGIFEKGYRLVVNCGQEGGQAVPHLHMHLLGGRGLAGRLG